MKHEVNWKGLDQGVEHTWRPEVLTGVLKLIQKHQPVPHRDPDSPFYEDLESEFPGKKWRAFDSKDGSFRPIFRRSNTWKKLGLINEIDREFSLSLAGKKLLSGEIGLNELYADVCHNHIENGEKPYVVLAELLLHFQGDTFTPDDVLSVLHYWRPEDQQDPVNLLKSQHSLDKEYLVTDLYKTRRRRVNAMLKLFTLMNATEKVDKEFKVSDVNLLLQITNTSQKTSTHVLSEKTEESPTASVSTTAKKRVAREERSVSQFSRLAAKEHDPLQRLTLLERATREHELAVGKFCSLLEKEYGKQSFENTSGYDISTELGNNRGLLVEVKTVTSSNAQKQIREAVSQLYEYSFKFKSELPERVQRAILLDKNPTGFIPDWTFEYLANDREIALWWFEGANLISAPLSPELNDTIENF